MSTKHTPGPWKVVAVDWSPEGNARFEIEGVHRTGIADARLIEAAPDLLAALQVVLRDYTAVHDIGDVEMQPALHQARAAIAKAEGRA